MTQRLRYSTLADQVQWQHPKMSYGNIDQTRLSIAGAPTDAEPFSFIVMGDTDAGIPIDAGCSDFSVAFAQQLTSQIKDSQFFLHTGDVTYPVGSYENYLQGFLKPYQSLLSSFPSSPGDRSESVVFNRPLLPIPGNHDYAEAGYGLWQKALRVVCDRLRHFGLDLGHYGGQGGEAYGQTFLDTLQGLSPEQLTAHLVAHYNAAEGSAGGSVGNITDGPARSYHLNYQPNQFTRLPNRYYRFRYGGVDFFALDSNTWKTDANAQSFDQAQLDWLESALIESWQTPGTVGRIVYLHHSPYTTEAIRWQQSETLWVRKHLRSTFSQVAKALSESHLPNEFKATARSGFSHTESTTKANPVVDLVLSGHAHCLEHVRTADTGYGDAYTDWVVCGGSGAALRRQREAGADILEKITTGAKSRTCVVAKSSLYAGIHGHNHKRQQLHSFLRVEIQPNQLKALQVRPYVVSRNAQGWHTTMLSPISVGRARPERSTGYTHRKAS